VIAIEPMMYKIFPWLKKTLLRKVNARKKLIGSHPLFRDLKGILIRNTKITASIMIWADRL
jgi:hypothetical protein